MIQGIKAPDEREYRPRHEFTIQPVCIGGLVPCVEDMTFEVAITVGRGTKKLCAARLNGDLVSIFCKMTCVIPASDVVQGNLWGIPFVDETDRALFVGTVCNSLTEAMQNPG